MFDKLIEFLLSTIKSFIPWVVIEPYQRGLRLRLGIFKEILEPGFHWRIPFNIDGIYTETVVSRTASITALSTTTSDGKSIGFDAVVTYRIKDLKVAGLEVYDIADAITDSCAGIIGTMLTKSSWDDIKGGNVVEELTAACRKRGFRWGVEIQNVQLKGIAIVKNIRLAVNMPTSHPGTNLTGE